MKVFLKNSQNFTCYCQQSGEMYVQSPTVMKGYYKNEKATKESLTEDGFYKTGDMGYYDPKKGLFITDRIKELIKVRISGCRLRLFKSLDTRLSCNFSYGERKQRRETCMSELIELYNR